MSPSSTTSAERWDWGSKSFDLSAPPPGSGITVTPLADGVRVTVRMHELWHRWPYVLFGLMVCAVGIHFALQTRRALPTLQSRPCYEALVHVGISILLILAGVNGWYRHLVLTISGDELQVALVSLWYVRHRHRRRAEVRWIAAWEGLRIVAGERTLLVKLRDDADRIAWLAVFLRAVLQLPREMEPQPGEIEVHFTTNRGFTPDRGFLLAKKGRLAFRFDFIDVYVYELADYGQSEGFIFPRCANGQQRWLSPDDVRCRIDEGDLAQLEILCGSGRREFWLTAWCADKDALQSALARFRGARDERNTAD